MSEAPNWVPLRRSVLARLFSGFWLQPFLTALVVLNVALLVFLSTLVGPKVLTEVPVTVVLLAFWGCGVTAWARADGTGVTWRYFRRHEVPWAEVDEIRYGSTFVPNTGPTMTRPTVFVRSHAVEHPIVPAYGCAREELARFADAVAALAAAHGVRAEATSATWSGLGSLPGVERGPHGSPGRVVSRSLRRLRLRLTGVAMVVVAVCAFVGAFTGAEASGTGERVVFGVVGLFLLLFGLLLIALPGT